MGGSTNFLIEMIPDLMICYNIDIFNEIQKEKTDSERLKQLRQNLLDFQKETGLYMMIEQNEDGIFDIKY